VAAFIAVKIVEYVFGNVTGVLGSVLKPIIFVVTWTAVSTQAAMRSVTKSVKQLRQGNQKAIKALTKSERL
jgi:hypothetical protein